MRSCRNQPYTSYKCCNIIQLYNTKCWYSTTARKMSIQHQWFQVKHHPFFPFFFPGALKCLGSGQWGFLLFVESQQARETLVHGTHHKHSPQESKISALNLIIKIMRGTTLQISLIEVEFGHIDSPIDLSSSFLVASKWQTFSHFHWTYASGSQYCHRVWL